MVRPDDWGEFGLPEGIQLLVVVFILGIVIVIGTAVWVVSTLARGALVSGVDSANAGGAPTFGKAFGAAWRKAWTLIGIGILPAIPALLLLIAGVAGLATYMGWSRMLSAPTAIGPNYLVLSIVGALACVALPIAMVLGLLQTFANRAAMLEGVGVFAAYKRGLAVLFDNIGSAILLFLIQVGINIAVGLLTMLPVIVMALCCVFWPVLLLLQGAVAAYMSTMWTLAWGQWTGREGQTLAA
jgi:hypothetical protein